MKNLYLYASNYNRVKVLEELAKVIEKNGGYIVETISDNFHFKKEVFSIQNDSFHEKAMNNFQRINIAKKIVEKYPEKKDIAEKAIKNYETENEDLEEKQKQSEFISCFGSTFGAGLSFVLDGFGYTISVDDNCFMPDYYTKRSLDKNHKVKNSCYVDEIDKSVWCLDCFSLEVPGDSVKAAALKLFNFLINAKQSEFYRDKYKRETAFVPSKTYKMITFTRELLAFAKDFEFIDESEYTNGDTPEKNTFSMLENGNLKPIFNYLEEWDEIPETITLKKKLQQLESMQE